MLHLNHLFCLAAQWRSCSTLLRHAGSLAQAFGARLHVMPVAGEAEEELRRLSATYDEETATINIDILPAAPPSVQDIRHAVEENNADLIVIPPLADSLPGSLMEKVDRPVYVVGQGPPPEQIDRILVPTDFSQASLQALKHATELASIYESSVDLLHVIHSSPYVALRLNDRLSFRGTPLPEHRARRRLEHFLSAGREAEITVQSHLAYGTPADQIVRVLDRQAVDLLVLSSHGTRASPHCPFGAVTEQVLERVAAPILLVKTFGHSLLTEGGDSTKNDNP